MAIAFDNDIAAGGFSTGGSITTLTVGSGPNRALLCYFVKNSGTATGSTITATWGGTNIPVIASDGDSAFLGLVNPASGTPSLVMSFSGGGTIYAYVISVTGADQTGGTTTFYGFNTANATSTSLTVPVTINTAGDMAVAGYINSTAPNVVGFTTAATGIAIGTNTSQGSAASNASAANYLITSGTGSTNMTFNMSGTTFGIADGIAIKSFTGSPFATNGAPLIFI